MTARETSKSPPGVSYGAYLRQAYGDETRQLSSSSAVPASALYDGGQRRRELGKAERLSVSSDGSELEREEMNSAGARSLAMRELRDRIQRERQQLVDLETQLASRKPIVQMYKASPNTRISPSTPANEMLVSAQAKNQMQPSAPPATPSVPVSPLKSVPETGPNSSKLSQNANTVQETTNTELPSRFKEEGAVNGDSRDIFHVGRFSSPKRENKKSASQNAHQDVQGWRSPDEVRQKDIDGISAMRVMLVSLEAEHGRFRGAIAALKDSVSKIEEDGREKADQGSASKKIVHEVKLHILHLEEQLRAQDSIILDQGGALEDLRIEFRDLKDDVNDLKQKVVFFSEAALSALEISQRDVHQKVSSPKEPRRNETNTDTRGLTFSHGDSLSLSEGSANITSGAKEMAHGVATNVVDKLHMEIRRCLRDDDDDYSDPCATNKCAQEASLPLSTKSRLSSTTLSMEESVKVVAERGAVKVATESGHQEGLHLYGALLLFVAPLVLQALRKFF